MSTSLRFALVGTSVALLSCASPPERAVCADFDCSGHGICTVVEQLDEQLPTCLCDPGYVPSPSGWLCLPPGDTSLCAEIDCSGHGRCVSVRGAPRCLCDEGYELDDTRLRCVSPCAQLSCSGHGSCQLDDGAPRCSCNPGYRATADGTDCERAAGPFVVYLFTTASNPGWVLGRATLDFGETDEIKESLEYGFPVDWGGRGFTRRARQIWKLDGGGDQLTALELDDRVTQGDVARQRRVVAVFDQGNATVTSERAGARFEHSFSYPQGVTPVPMLGGFEYPSLSLGCFSPAFYLLALRRYDVAAGGEQQVEVFWPTSGTTELLRVRLDPDESTPQAPVLELIDQQIRVTYENDLPRKIFFERQEWTWERSAVATPAAVNLPEPPPTTTVVGETLPAVVEQSTTVTSADGTVLGAVLTRPAGASGPVPAVLLVSGPMALDRDHPHHGLPRAPLARHLAAHLAAAGYGSLRYEPRGRGRGQLQWRQARRRDLEQDARAALARLRGDDEVDAGRVFLLSFGWGATVALPLLTGDSGVRGYLGLAPVVADLDQAALYTMTEHLANSGFSHHFLDRQRESYEETIAQLKNRSYQRSELFLGTTATMWGDLMEFDGRGALARFTGPVLLVRGSEDLETSSRQLGLAQLAAAAQGKQNLTSTTLEGLSFGFSSGEKRRLWERSQLPLRLAPELIDTLTSWLDAN